MELSSLMDESSEQVAAAHTRNFMYLQTTHGGAAAISGPKMTSQDPPLGGRRLWFVGQLIDYVNPGLRFYPGAATVLAAYHGGCGQGIS